ncbi:DUF948 domain-containing protein [Oscillatoria sp. CS-180]|uniref:DUF948 domain-containing protein n=1 Tax=Oscillatoria sp. CS-180 TaxID=3021720 RepID=UPI00232D236D|nr:DUF948 domain-containing protein [Oscillatoria sp. CS-180]MDB9526862.1 DUF948 domain-containing protein [Oscillatoria sp. CS-180]
MINPLFWLFLSFLLVSMSLTAVLVVLVPAVRELSRAARSVEKLCDTLSRDLPPTLESIRLTSIEINNLTDDVNEGVQSASRVAQQVDQSVGNVRVQAKRVQVGTRSLMAGFSAAWTAFNRPKEGRERSLSKKSRSPQPDVTAYRPQSTPLQQSPNHYTASPRQSAGQPVQDPTQLPTAQKEVPELLPGDSTEVDFSSGQPSQDAANTRRSTHPPEAPR